MLVSRVLRIPLWRRQCGGSVRSLYTGDRHRCPTPVITASKSNQSLDRRNGLRRFSAYADADYSDYEKGRSKEKAQILIFPTIPSDTLETNQLLALPGTGQIDFDALTVEKCIRATGKLCIEYEHFCDEYSRTLLEESGEHGISNSKLDEFIRELELRLLPLSYNLSLLEAFRIIRPKEFNFKSFNHFVGKRYSKMDLRYYNRNIYTFMCEMKARRESFSDSEESEGSTVTNQTGDDTKNVAVALKDDQFVQQQRNQLVDRYIRESKLFGLSLKMREEYDSFGQKLAEVQQSFVYTASLATNLFQKNIMSPQFLDCLPDHVITQINHNDADSVFRSFMRYCNDQNMRKDFWLSFYSRASSSGDTKQKLSNLRNIEIIRDYRHQRALLSGYDNFAQMAIDLRGPGGTTMAGSVDNVRAFIAGLGARSEKRFQTNLSELADFATLGKAKTGGGGSKAVTTANSTNPNNFVTELQLWDLKYFERLYRRELYKVDSRDVRAHFPINRVVSGMFDFAESLFGIKIVEAKDGGVSGPNMRHYKVFNNSGQSTAEYGSFYFDPFQSQPRIVPVIPRCESLHTKPVVLFLMNFTANVGSLIDQYDNQLLATGKEMLSFDQVLNLFANFGIVLQLLMTEVGLSEIGALANVEADAYHLVSNFMQLWPLNSYEVIAKCSGHVNTNEPISEEFFDRIRKSHQHFRSIDLKRQLYLIALDLNLHTQRDFCNKVQKQTWNEWMAPFELNKDDNHICSMRSLFGGGSQEGIYYSSKWSEVIAADLFDAFRDDRSGAMKSAEQIASLGQRFKQTLLAQTGAVETNELFRRFLGRDPTLNGYLSVHGYD